MAEMTFKSDDAREPPTEPDRPTAPVGVIEMDRFCDRCGYNLRTQAVTRDEHTGILICRCPECGTFHPAGVATDAGRAWWGRFGTLLLLFWVLILLSCAANALVGMGVLQYIHLEEFTRYERVEWQERVDGEIVRRSQHRRVLRRPRPGYYSVERYAEQMAWTVRAFVASSAGLGVVSGGLLAIFCWHLSRRACYATLLSPLLVGLFVYWIWTFETVELRGWGFQRIGLHALCQCAGMALGILLGRPIVRFFLPFLLPSSLLQHLAFLWHVDGRKVPAPRQDMGRPGQHAEER